MKEIIRAKGLVLLAGPPLAGASHDCPGHEERIAGHIRRAEIQDARQACIRADKAAVKVCPKRWKKHLLPKTPEEIEAEKERKRKYARRYYAARKAKKLACNKAYFANMPAQQRAEYNRRRREKRRSLSLTVNGRRRCFV
ncbi:MAG: hypothetical protein HZA50_11715 [Planctomycetes bacterium]|nr:hypothetical protein [Planctomycetota bacterium]